jgi:DNA-binding NarL/FixJ family response regulator
MPRKAHNKGKAAHRASRIAHRTSRSRAMYDPKVTILAAVDDFLFRSKIRAVAKHVGVEIKFAQTRDEILADARELKPVLAIIDLNSSKTDPIATITALKEDSATKDLPTIGFVSHVHTDLIAAARRAGADEVLPRSAFAARLPQILSRG